MREKVMNAAINLLERKDYDILDTEVEIGNDVIDIIAFDPVSENVIFVDVSYREADEGNSNFSTDTNATPADRRRWEKLMVNYMMEHVDDLTFVCNYRLRMDKIEMIVLNEKRAVVRHIVNYLA